MIRRGLAGKLVVRSVDGWILCIRTVSCVFRAPAHTGWCNQPSLLHWPRPALTHIVKRTAEQRGVVESTH